MPNTISQILLETGGSAYEFLFLMLLAVWEFIRVWWWVPLPFILFHYFKFFWKWWRVQFWYEKNIKFILLEIKPPKEVLTPIKGMETVFSGFWHLYDPPNPREKWLEGKDQMGLSLEIVSLGGESHFFIRIPEGSRDLIESVIYAQYPDAEINEVEDYTKNVPQDLPNKEWNMWGTDYELLKEDIYPIKTYSKFFEESPFAPKEEKRIDPVSALLEGMAKFKPGEQLWVQIIIKPVAYGIDDDYVKRGQAEVDILAKRTTPGKPYRPLLLDALDMMITGEPKKEEEAKKEEIIPVEMRMTPGEREVVAGIEEKISKYAFETSIRFVHLGKIDDYFGARKAIPMGFFDQYCTTNLNAMKPWSKTITKVHTVWFFFLDKRRAYTRKRTMFRNYVNRFGPLFPSDSEKGSFILNIEELASMFHFPGKMVTSAPGFSRVESRRGEAPSGLPVEE